MSAFQIHRGNPTPEEIAIAISVLHAAAGANAVAAVVNDRPRSNWAAPARLLRPGTHRVGHGAWTLSQRIR